MTSPQSARGFFAKHTFICFPCRNAKRAKVAGGLITNYRCSLCREPLIEADYRWRVPSKTDVKGWKALQALIFKKDISWTPRRTALGLEKLQKIDAEIVAVKARPPGPAKERHLKRMGYERQLKTKQYNLAGLV